MGRFQFSPAVQGESLVYGACRPGRQDPDSTVQEWINFMQEQGIERVCCLLTEHHLGEYDALLNAYERAFGPEDVCHAPIPDFEFVDSMVFQESIRPFLRASDEQGARTVVHCSAGRGRTGHVLSLWLAAEHGYRLEAAVDAVKQAGRHPLEAGSRAELATRLN